MYVHGERPVVILGIAPGLKSIAYSVLSVTSGQDGKVTTVDHDVLLGGRLNSLANLAKKAYVHALVLDVVFERDPPEVLAIGPACNPKEPLPHVWAVRVMLSELAHKFGVRVVDVDEALMTSTLDPSPRESLARCVNRRLGSPLDSDDRRLVMAVGVAMTGAILQGREPRAR